MFNEYQKQAVGTFKPAKVIQDDQKIHAVDWGLGLGGEAGEVQDLVKHHVFHGEALDKMQLAKELGDVLWYITAMCETFGMSLQDVAELNIAKLSHRYNKGYNENDSANRHAKELTFEESPIYKILEARIKQTGDAPVNVIFIGPDGAGKTTLLKNLSSMVDMPVCKCDYHTEDRLSEAHKLLDSQINVLYDRFYYPDDTIYGTVKNLKFPDYTEVVHKLKTLNPIFVYVTAPLDILEKRASAWQDNYVTKADLPKIIKQYGHVLSFLRDLGFPILKLNMVYALDSVEYQQQLHEIKEFIDLWKYQFCNIPAVTEVEG